MLKTNETNLIDEACVLLTDAMFIKKSLVMPYQIDLALEILMTEFSNQSMNKISIALNTAYEISIPNLKEMFAFGKTAVVFDSSGSMRQSIHLGLNYEKKQIRGTDALNKAALIAATLAKGLGADAYTFATSCHTLNYNINDSVNTIKNKMISDSNAGGGTNWSNIFNYFKTAYDRVFIISDEQDSGSVESYYKSYCNTYGTPNIFIINICGYGPTVLKQSAKVHRIFGYNANVFETVKQVEIDPNAIIKEINKIVI